VGVALQLWGPDGSLASSTAHVELLAESLVSDRVRIDEVPVDLDAITALEAASGPVVAWLDADDGSL
jgi:hypothetical protein